MAPASPAAVVSRAASAGHHSGRHEHHGPALTPAVIEVGAGFGAVLLWVDEALNGAEIETRRDGSPWEGSHVEVRERTSISPSRFSALFASLPEGVHHFRVRNAGHGPEIRVAVAEASISEATLKIEPR